MASYHRRFAIPGPCSIRPGLTRPRGWARPARCPTLFTPCGSPFVAITEGIERVLWGGADFSRPMRARSDLHSLPRRLPVLRRGPAAKPIVVVPRHQGYYGTATHATRSASLLPDFHTRSNRPANAGWAPRDVDWVFRTTSARSWSSPRPGAPPCALLWSSNIARHGQPWRATTSAICATALDGGAIEPGATLLLFSYGYGAHWTALAVEA